jgi:hypothetical protein
MTAAQFGYLTGSFAGSLMVAAVWLIICNFISPLRARPGVTHGIAVALAFVPALITLGGPNTLNIEGTLLCVVLLLWQYRRAEKKQRGAATAATQSK